MKKKVHELITWPQINYDFTVPVLFKSKMKCHHYVWIYACSGEKQKMVSETFF